MLTRLVASWVHLLLVVHRLLLKNVKNSLLLKKSLFYIIGLKELPNNKINNNMGITILRIEREIIALSSLLVFIYLVSCQFYLPSIP